MSGVVTRQAPGELPVIWEVIDQHLEEAGALWSGWEEALLAPDRTLAELAASDEERLLAHLEGLVVGGPPVAIERLLPALADDMDHELVLAAALGLLCGPAAVSHLEPVLESLATAEGACRAALVRAMQLAPLCGLEVLVAHLAGDTDPALRAAAIEVLAFHRADLSGQLPVLLQDNDAAVRTQAMKAARHPQGATVLPLVAHGLEDPSPRVRHMALEAGLVHGLEPCRQRCRELAAQPGEGRFLLLLCLAEGADALEPLTAALSRSGDADAALLACGYLGLPETVPGILEHLDGPPETARLAGEAFCAITGLDLVASGMTVQTEVQEPDEPVPLEHEDLEGDLVPSPEDHLPLPDAAAVRSWWEHNRSCFAPGQRYLAGQPVTGNAYRLALFDGPLRRRHTLALELAIRTRGRLMPETRTWARVQLQVLAATDWSLVPV